MSAFGDTSNRGRLSIWGLLLVFCLHAPTFPDIRKCLGLRDFPFIFALSERYSGRECAQPFCQILEYEAMSAIDAFGEYLEDVVYRSVCKAMTEVAPKPQEKIEEEIYISRKEACKFLGVKTTAFYDRLKCSTVKIKTRKVDGRREICLNDLKKLQETNAIGRYARFKGKD